MGPEISTKINIKTSLRLAAKTRSSALQYYRAAAHLFYHTYNLSKDPKIFVAILLNLHAAIKELKKSSKRPIQSASVLWKELETLKRWQSQSSTEFKRGQQWVMCSEKYKMKVLTAKKIERLINLTKNLI